jgi:L-fuculose-phosphate aldolase
MSTDSLRQKVSLACKVLFASGQEHFYLGHVSVRDPGNNQIWVKPSGIGLGEVTPVDVVACDFANKKVTEGRSLHHEMPIHTEIYRRRPDVNCVVHTHPFYAAAYAAAHTELKMVSQDSVLFADGVGHFDSAELVVTTEQGQKLAESLGDKSVVVMKHHGITSAADTVENAIFLALSFDRSVQIQHTAMAFGEIDPIPEHEVDAMRNYFDNNYGGRVETTWNYLLRRAGIAPNAAVESNL